MFFESTVTDSSDLSATIVLGSDPSFFHSVSNRFPHRAFQIKPEVKLAGLAKWLLRLLEIAGCYFFFDIGDAWILRDYACLRK
jgi:hypothetical protein